MNGITFKDAARNFLMNKSAAVIDRLFGTVSRTSGRQDMPTPTPFDQDTAISFFRSWVYVAAQRNAVALAASNIRLFSARGTGMPEPKHAPFRHVDRSDWHRLLKAGGTPAGKINAAADVLEITEHPFIELMKNVNEYRDAFDFTEETSLWADCTGNTYWYIETGTGIMKGLPVALYIMPSNMVRIKAGKTRLIDAYIYGQGLNLESFSPEEVIQFRRPSLRSQLYGLSRIEAAWYAVSSHEAIEQYEQQLAKNRAIPDLLLKYKKGRLDPAQARRKLIDWNAQFRGIHNAGGVGIMDEDFDVEPLGYKPNELGFIQGRPWRRDEILNAFGQSVALYSENPNRANIDGAIYIWSRYELKPTLTRMEQKQNAQLIPMYGEPTLFCAYDNIVEDDKDFRQSQEAADRQNNIMTINEIRQSRGLEPIDDERADDVFAGALNPADQPVSLPGTMPGQRGEKSIDGGRIHKSLAGTRCRISLS
jgi:HK97 family phage portal protein